MADIVKVKQLYAVLGKLIKEGKGDCDLYCMSDEEGNDYYPMWFTPTSDPEKVKSLLESTCSGLMNCKDPNKAVVLG